MKDPHGMPKAVLRGLQAEHPVVKRAAVTEVFRQLGQHSQYQSAEGAALLQQCVSSKDRAVVEEAVQQLISFVPKPGLSIADGTQILLAALATSGEAGASLLVNGVVELLYKSAGQGTVLPKLPSGHPLFKTLCAHASASAQLLACFEALIAQPEETPETRRQWLQWQPFISLVLLDHGEGAARLPFAMQLYATMVNGVRETHCGDLGDSMAALLLSSLPASSLKTPQQRSLAAGCCVAMLDLCNMLSNSGLSGRTAMAVLHVCFELTQHGNSILGILPDLSRALRKDRALLQACLPSLALLAQVSPQHAADVIMDDMLSLCTGLDSLPPSLRGLLEMPLLTSVAFGWPCRAQKAKPMLDWLMATARTGSIPAQVEARQDLLGQPALVAVAAATLDRLFQPDTGGSEALQWLQSIRWDLSSASSKGAQLSEVSMFMLCALLEHSAASVKMAAAETMAAAAKAVPVCGISFLPVLVHHLQQLAAKTPESGVQQHAEVELALMRAIPAMAHDAASLPYVTRVLGQLCPPDAPDRLHAVSVRLHCQLWKETGHNFNKLRGLLIPDRTQLRMTATAALTTAAALKEVCLRDTDRGMQLIEGIQFFLPSASPGPAALALEALGVLCQRGGISFPDAWKLLREVRLQRPEHELPRAAWTALLGHAHTTAEKHPEQAAAHQHTLWEATKDPFARVRAAAYSALACWSFELLELLELARPLDEYSRLLLEETDSMALAACEALVIRALAYEHARRRRHIGARPKAGKTGPSAAGAGDAAAESPTSRRLTRLIPKQLLSNAPNNLGVVLLLWAPAKPASRAGSSRAELAASAAQDYAAKFDDIICRAADGAPVVEPPLLLHSWRCFLARWVGVASAAAEEDVLGQTQEARQKAYAEVWDAIEAGMLLSTREACLAVHAAGALQGLAVEHCPRVTQEIQLTLQAMAHDCRSESLSQAILDGMTDVDPDSIQRSSSVVVDFLNETYGLVTFTQQIRDKARATESVHELAKMPGMLQSSALDYSQWEVAANWLISVVSNACTPGKGVGAAAAALGCVINALPSRSDFHTGSLAALLEKALAALQAAAETAPRMSQSANVRTGIAQGLAALLGAPHMLPDAAGGDTWLLTRADCAGHAKQALEMLEALTQQEVAANVREVAAWCLAAAAASARASSKGLQTSNTGGRAQTLSSDEAALAALPDESAMRALIEHLRASCNDSGSKEAASKQAATCNASILRCLAAAERLPPVDWERLCAQCIRQQGPGSNGLVSAAMELLISHPDAPGCGTALLKLLGEQEFERLPVSARQQLLEGCGSMLGSLGPAQQDQVIKSLPSLSSGNALLAASAWKGLGNFLRRRAKAQPPVDVPLSACATMGHMLEALPVPAQPSPGIEAWLHEEHSSTADQQHLVGQEGVTMGLACSDSMGPDWQLWKAALHALAAMREAQIGSVLLKQQQGWIVQQVFAVSIMVAWQKLPTQHLAECRAWCLSTPAAETQGVPATVARACALTCQGQSSANQGQLLIQLLDPRQVFPDLDGFILTGASMGLAALYTAALE
ncbi:g2828 [Coccomyxa viridis]|uniref:G2828 protein n=1 Tax=Coccomyxa viridis TaxID=1274662 RepID=A0ABP1FLC7_9CHLO